MARLFDRRVAVTVDTFRFVSDPSLTAEPIVLGDGIKIFGFKIAFKIELTHSSKPNKAEVQIWGLNEGTRGRIAVTTLKPQFIIEAGYVDTIAQVFKGEAVEISTTKNAPGVVTTVKGQDGFKASKQRISLSMSPGALVGDAIAQIAETLEVNATKAISRAKSGDLTGGVKQLFSGLSVSGNSQNELDKFAKTYGFDTSIQDGELQFLLPGETTKETAILLNEATGLIGSPARVIDDKLPNKIIAKGRSLMQPKMSPGRRLEIESDEVDGSFRILSVIHSGQSDVGDFYSDFEAVEI